MHFVINSITFKMFLIIDFLITFRFQTAKCLLCDIKLQRIQLYFECLCLFVWMWRSRNLNCFCVEQFISEKIVRLKGMNKVILDLNLSIWMFVNSMLNDIKFWIVNFDANKCIWLVDWVEFS